jgi:hypothetical protein
MEAFADRFSVGVAVSIVKDIIFTYRRKFQVIARSIMNDDCRSAVGFGNRKEAFVSAALLRSDLVQPAREEIGFAQASAAFYRRNTMHES